MSILSRKHIIWKSTSGTNTSNSLKNIAWTKERPKVESTEQAQVTYESIPSKKQTQSHKSTMLVPTREMRNYQEFTVRSANTCPDTDYSQPTADNTAIYQTFYKGEQLLQLTEKEYIHLRGIVGKMFRSGEKDQSLLLPSGVVHPLAATPTVTVPVKQQKTATVAVIGLPNAGKSTLLNRLLGDKVVAVSRKRNTTRKTHTVYVTRDDKQLSIYDTPGMIGSDDAAKVHHERSLLVAAWNAATTADVCFVVVDSSSRIAREATKRMLIELKERMEEQGKQFCSNILTQQETFHRDEKYGSNKQVWILGLNKVDHLANRQYLPDMAKEFYDIFPFAMSFMISAKKDKGVDHVRDFLFGLCKPGPWLSPLAVPYGGCFVDMMEDILREKLLHSVHFEVPYHAKFQLESCKLCSSSGVIAVEERLVLERKSQIGMVLGPQGSNLKWIQRAAESDLSQAWKLPVILYLSVKSDS